MQKLCVAQTQKTPCSIANLRETESFFISGQILRNFLAKYFTGNRKPLFHQKT